MQGSSGYSHMKDIDEKRVQHHIQQNRERPLQGGIGDVSVGPHYAGKSGAYNGSCQQNPAVVTYVGQSARRRPEV